MNKELVFIIPNVFRFAVEKNNKEKQFNKMINERCYCGFVFSPNKFRIPSGTISH